MTDSIINSIAERQRIDGQFADIFDAATGDETECGFDLTDFGNAWPAFADELGLIYDGRAGADSAYGFVWRNAVGLMVVTGCQPETGEYHLASCPKRRAGYASYMGAEGPADQIAAFVAGVRRHASYIKDYSRGRRAYI